MRIAAAYLTLFLLMVSAHVVKASIEPMTVYGSDYVRIADWCRANGCSMQWDKSEGVVEVTGTNTRVNFTIDSRRAQVTGVTVWMALPVINRGGVPMVALMDIRSTLAPLLAPRKTASRVQTICLDPGHGGRDGGKAEGSNYEKKYTLLLAEETACLLKQQGFKVLLTRTNDQAVELFDRPQIASRRGADLFVSLHYNSAEPSVHGVEVFCLTPPGSNSSDDGGGKSSRPAEMGNITDDHNVLLGYQVQRSITRNLPLEDLGLKRSRFEVLRMARIPAILVEGGFLTNSEDARNISDTEFRKKMARAIVDGIIAYRTAVTN